MPFKNAQIEREYFRTYYHQHPDKIKQKVKARQEKIRKWIQVYKSNLACQVCGETHPACLEFHHRDPLTKDINLGSVVSKGWSITHIQNEIAKCDVLCSNCHKKLHWNTE